MKYNYKESITEDIMDYINKNYDLEEYAGYREKLKDDIKEDIAYEVSGAAAGSYTCDAPTARHNLEGNEDLIKEAYYLLGIEDHLPNINGKLVDDEDIVKYIDNPEKADMYIREAFAESYVEDALKQIEEKAEIDLSDSRTFAYSETLLLSEELPEDVLSDIEDITEVEVSEDGKTLTFPDITADELSEVTSNLEYEDIDFEFLDKVKDEKVFVVYEMKGNFSDLVFKGDTFNEAQDYLTDREQQARAEAEQNGEEFKEDIFYSYFSGPTEMTVAELTAQEKGTNPKNKPEIKEM